MRLVSRSASPCRRNGCHTSSSPGRSNHTNSLALLTMGQRQVGLPTRTHASAWLTFPVRMLVVYGSDDRWSYTAPAHALEHRSARDHLAAVLR